MDHFGIIGDVLGASTPGKRDQNIVSRVACFSWILKYNRNSSKCVTKGLGTMWISITERRIIFYVINLFEKHVWSSKYVQRLQIGKEKMDRD